MSKELPEPWAAELSGKGVHSYRDFAAKVGDGIGHETLRRLVTGGATSDNTVKRVADALFGGDRTKVWGLYGSIARDYGDWTPPSEASLLNGEERAAVDNLIHVFTKGRHRRTAWSEREDLPLEQGDVSSAPMADLIFRDGDRLMVVEIKHTSDADEAREQLRQAIEDLADSVTVKAVPSGSLKLGTTVLGAGAVGLTESDADAARRAAREEADKVLAPTNKGEVDDSTEAGA